MFFLILVCTFYSTKKLIGEVIGNIKFEDEKLSKALDVELLAEWDRYRKWMLKAAGRMK